MHRLCQQSAAKLLAKFQPQLMIAIGGGGYVPARIMRSFLKQPGSPNIPIQAIGLSLYESLGDDSVEAIGTKVTRTQWLDMTALGQMENLVGKRILIVDEVDDTRTTLEYAVRELQKDVEAAARRMGGDQPKTHFSIFVLHVRPAPPPATRPRPAPPADACAVQNKDKPKKGVLPNDMLETSYEAAQTVGDVWINYPWEATDIEEHDRLAALSKNGHQ